MVDWLRDDTGFGIHNTPTYEGEVIFSGFAFAMAKFIGDLKLGVLANDITSYNAKQCCKGENKKTYIDRVISGEEILKLTCLRTKHIDGARYEYWGLQTNV